jgi:hypothetical protein
MGGKSVIKKSVLEQLEREQEVIKGRFGSTSRAMYDNLSAGLKEALNDLPREIIASGVELFTEYARRCGYVIE